MEKLAMNTLDQQKDIAHKTHARIAVSGTFSRPIELSKEGVTHNPSTLQVAGTTIFGWLIGNAITVRSLQVYVFKLFVINLERPFFANALGALKTYVLYMPYDLFSSCWHLLLRLDFWMELVLTSGCPLCQWM